jgi:gamma-tubulin complex component 3
MAWTFEPKERLRWLALLVDHSKGLKGGTLVADIARLAQHGDPSVARVVAGVLTATARPLNVMLHTWLLDGEMDDPYGEFFIAADETVIRADMVQRFF